MDNIRTRTDTPSRLVRSTYAISWSAIIAGTLFAVAIEAALNLFALGSGFAVLSYTPDTTKTITAGGTIWLVLSTAISLFGGAWLAGYVEDETRADDASGGIMQALMIWTFTTMISLAIIGSGVGLILSGVSKLAKDTIQMAAELQTRTGVTMMISERGFEDMKASITNKLKDRQVNSEVINRLLTDIKEYLLSSDENKKQEMRKKIIRIITDNSQLSEEDVNNLLNQWSQAYVDFRNRASANIKQGLSEASSVLSTSFMVLFLANIIGAVAAIAGGRMGYRRIPNLRSA